MTEAVVSMNSDTLPELSTGWVWTTFLSTCEPLSDDGKKIKQKDYLASGKYPIVDQGADEVGGYTNDARLLFDGDLPVIAFGDHTRRFKLITKPFAVGADGVKLFRPGSAWIPRCLFYFFKVLKFEDRGYSRHFQFVRKSSLPLPPEKEQQRIVDALDELLSDLDAGVDAMKRAQAKLELCRASVLNAAVEGVLLPSKCSYPLRQIKEAIESMGQGWSPKCETSPSNTPQEWAVIKTTAIQPLHFLEQYNKRLPITLKPRANLELMNGDLLITRAGPRTRVGIACMVRDVRPRLILCDKAYRIRCKPGTLTPAFLEVVLNSPRTAEAINDLKTGINDSGLNLTQQRFSELLVPFPSLNEQNAIVEEVENRLSIVEHVATSIGAKLEAAQSLRQAAFHHAFTGKLVKQYPGDEPASELLKRISADHAVRAKKSKAMQTRKPVKGRKKIQAT